MKKILLATSILAATTGYAAAEVAVSGTGRMGIVYDGNDVQFSSRARVIFDLSAESDNGLSFGIEGQNLTNERVIKEGYDGAAFFGFTEAYYNPPRRIYATVRYAF